MAQTSKVSPFPTARHRSAEHIDVSMLKVEHKTPLPSSVRSSQVSKYEPIFEQLKPGSCIVCEFDERGTIVTALVKYIKRKGLKCITKSLGRCEDGHARIWMLKAE